MDSKDDAEVSDDHPDADPVAHDKDENVSATSSSTKCLTSNYAKEHSVSDAHEIEDNTIKNKDEYSLEKSEGVSEENIVRDSESDDVSHATVTLDENGKKQTVRLHRKHLFSASLPTHSSIDKRVAVPIKKKSPAITIIRTLSCGESDLDDVADSEIEVRDSSSVRSEESSLTKTIIVSPYPILKERENAQLVLGSHSKDTEITFEGSGSSKDIILSRSECEKIKDSVTTTHSAGSSQASPYNTRFAHMKIGTIFPISSKSSGVSRRKPDRYSAKILPDNTNQHDIHSSKYEKYNVEDTLPDNGVCFLCGISFSDDMGISISVKKPLPLSNVDLVSLLESFSISCASVKNQNLNYVNMCNVCHTLVIDGDACYKQLFSVASEMREQWPYRALKKDPVFTLTIPDSCTDQFNNNENLSTDGLSSQRQDSVSSEFKKVRGRVGRPPKIKIKQEDDADVNWKPSQVKQERTTHTGRRGRPPKRKIKRERRGRPRKVVIKGEISDEEVFTCALCSESFYDEDTWGKHYESVHKPLLRWVNYRSQKKLKKLIFLNIQESFLNEEFIEIMCHACEGKFFEKHAFLDHLRCNHKMLIDDDFITALYNFSQGHETMEGLSESEAEGSFSAPSEGTIIKIERDALSSSSIKLEKSVKCKVCHVTLSDEKSLKEHTDTNHYSLVVISNDDTKEVVLPEKKPDNKKQNVGEELPSSSEVTDKENFELTDFVCEDCEDIFETRRDLLEHKLNIHGSNDDKGQEKGLVRYECEVCGRRIYGLAALKVHMTKVHYKTASSFKFSCNMCIYKAQSRSQLGKHMRMRHGKEIMPSVQCETCGKMYGSSYIAKHIATMHSTHNRNYECNFCDMKFFDMAGLKFHIYHEHANKVWKCNKCPSEFKKYHQLRQHRIFTHSTKVHACMECPKTYKRKSDLTEHVKRLHLQRVVLLCPRCPKQYVNRFKLRNHLMKQHDVPWEDTLARNYARHQRANNCRRTEDGVLEANKDQILGEENSIIIQESYDNFDRQKEMQEDGDSFEGQEEEQEYSEHFNRPNEEHEYHAHYRQSNKELTHQHQQRNNPLASVKMERDEHPEEYIEIMEATDAFAKDGITYVIIEET